MNGADPEERTNTDMNEIPGTAQIRRITAHYNAAELLEMSARLAEGGYDKKLFSVLSRVYTEKKDLGYGEAEGIDAHVETILKSGAAPELKMQTYTSFKLPMRLRPDTETVREWLKACPENRLNIAAFFLAAYGYECECSADIAANHQLSKCFAETASAEVLLRFYEKLLNEDSKETLTAITRVVKNANRHFKYHDLTYVSSVTKAVFESKNVFYTSKLIFCLAFYVPSACLPQGGELYKILKMCITYDEKTSKEFIKRYHMDMDVTDKAMCHYYMSNKKTKNEHPLVERFAQHLMKLESADMDRLLKQAFRRGGLFRMYAGCMRDGRVDEEKQRHFHCSEEDIAWVKTLPGLK